MSNFTLHHGDALEVLRGMPDNSIDAVVTDPPYGFAFMGKKWDYDLPSVEIWAEVLRVAKPGAHLLAFGGARTYHRAVCRIEDAGWEIRDCIQWIYGSGFPKSLDVSKAIDKAAGAERAVIGENPNRKGRKPEGYHDGWSRPWQEDENALAHKVTKPATEAAHQWAGWGTALKPAHEPIVLARKPLAGTVAANVAAWGCGALNVDGCRIGTTVETWPKTKAYRRYDPSSPVKVSAQLTGNAPAGRWPSNIIHDGSEEVLAGFPNAGGGYGKRGGDRQSAYGFGGDLQEVGYGDSGSAARFFYAAKPSRREREAGLSVTEEWLDTLELVWHNNTVNNLSEVLLWEEADRSQSTDWNGEALHVKGIFGDTTAEQAGSDSRTLLNGNCTTGLYLKAIRCITSTKTRLTIELKTLNSLAHLSINGNTEAAIRTGLEIGLSPAESAALKSLLKAIITNGAAVSRRGASLAAKKTPRLTSAKDALSQSLSANIHSTVKPIALMRYLCRLVTPPGGIVLDPFTGSGTTGAAAMLEGFRFIGIEREAEYVEIARRRIAHWADEREEGAEMPLFAELEGVA